MNSIARCPLARRAFLSAMLSAALLAGGGLPARAQEMPVFTLTLKGNRFDKAEIVVPANTRLVLLIKNQDATPEEFESHDLRVEKIVPAGKEIRLTVGPLKPGRYRFFGDYHEDTANGFLIAQ